MHNGIVCLDTFSTMYLNLHNQDVNDCILNTVVTAFALSDLSRFDYLGT